MAEFRFFEEVVPHRKAKVYAVEVHVGRDVYRGQQAVTQDDLFMSREPTEVIKSAKHKALSDALAVFMEREWPTT